jgi:hypothetical protein
MQFLGKLKNTVLTLILLFQHQVNGQPKDTLWSPEDGK